MRYGGVWWGMVGFGAVVRYGEVNGNGTGNGNGNGNGLVMAM